MNESTTDVLVVGAGPTGLLAASELARLGVRCRVIEKTIERPTQSRALAVHARTLEMLDLVGVANALASRGHRVPGMSLRFDGGPSVFVDMSPLATRFPYILIIPQPDTEAILDGHLASMGGTVERGTEWLDFEEHHGWISSRVRTADGGTSIVHARYLIGCDGAHSAVRHALGLPFSGAADDGIALLADVQVDGALDRGRLHLFSSRRGLAVLLPFKDGSLRVIAVDFTKQHASSTMQLELADVQDTIDAITPMRLVLSKPRWLTRFGAHHRQVSAYRTGRVFLAGDAAHVHNPAGGQGMNTGLQDAGNLAWKIAFVLGGRAPHALLESYHAERHPVGARVLRLTERMLRVFLARGPIRRATRNLAARAMFSFPRVRRTMRETISGLGVSYRFTSQARRDRCRGLSARALQAGDHAPDIQLEDARRHGVHLYEILRAPCYTLLVTASLNRLVHDRRRLAELVQSVEAYAGEALQSFVVLDVGVPDALGLEAPTLIDVRRELQHRLGAEHGSVMLIRPDGYVGFHLRAFDASATVRALRSWIRPAAKCEAPLSTPPDVPRQEARGSR